MYDEKEIQINPFGITEVSVNQDQKLKESRVKNNGFSKQTMVQAVLLIQNSLIRKLSVNRCDDINARLYTDTLLQIRPCVIKI